MNTYILILTIIAFRSGAYITHIDNLSKVDCLQIGEAWIKNKNKKYTSYVCVPLQRN